MEDDGSVPLRSEKSGADSSDPGGEMRQPSLLFRETAICTHGILPFTPVSGDFRARGDRLRKLFAVVARSRFQPGSLAEVRGNQQGGANQAEPLIRPVRPELDSIRGPRDSPGSFLSPIFLVHGLAVLSGIPKIIMVLSWAGWLGVDLFFVLSGFLITATHLDAKCHIDYHSRFYKRRALRILPFCFVVLSVLAEFRLAGGMRQLIVY